MGYDTYMLPGSFSWLLIASVVVAIVGALGYVATPFVSDTMTMVLTAEKHRFTPAEPIEYTVRVTAGEPVNVFAGKILFDDTLLAVENISYNTDMANLWAEKPWYDDGAGTIHFAGGTTRSGGFIGTDNLLTVTFSSKKIGTGGIALSEARLLLADGIGTDAQLSKPTDQLITIIETTPPEAIMLTEPVTAEQVEVVARLETDLNGDGTTSIADVSALLFSLTTQDSSADINGDGTVGTGDLSILLSALATPAPDRF